MEKGAEERIRKYLKDEDYKESNHIFHGKG